MAWCRLGARAEAASPIRHVAYLASGTNSVHCPGAGHADPGYLCVYESHIVDVKPGYVPPIQKTVGGDVTEAANAGAERNGFMVVLTSKDPERNILGWGTWTVSG